MAALLFLASLFPPVELPEVSLGDLAALPPESVVTLRLALADEYRTAILDRAATHGWGWGLRELGDEARACRKPWELLWVAQGHGEWFDPEPLDALRELRDRIGPVAYYRGAMPPAVPVWRFRRAD